MTSVVQDWLSLRCTLRQQATILSALRGCDGLSKHDPSKQITRALRRTILVPADPDYMNDENNTFMKGDLTTETVYEFLDDLDKYPLHFITHLMQSVMLIGMYHPVLSDRTHWTTLYRNICNRLHLTPEERTSAAHRLRDGKRTKEEERGARARI